MKTIKTMDQWIALNDYRNNLIALSNDIAIDELGSMSKGVYNYIRQEMTQSELFNLYMNIVDTLQRTINAYNDIQLWYEEDYKDNAIDSIVELHNNITDYRFNDYQYKDFDYMTMNDIEELYNNIIETLHNNINETMIDIANNIGKTLEEYEEQ